MEEEIEEMEEEEEGRLKTGTTIKGMIGESQPMIGRQQRDYLKIKELKLD